MPTGDETLAGALPSPSVAAEGQTAGLEGVVRSTRYVAGRPSKARYEGGRRPPLILPVEKPARRRRSRRPRWRDRTRRGVNVLASLFLILVTAPLMLATALLIKLTSRGPVLYVQPRVGLDRRGGPRDRRSFYKNAPYTQRRVVNHGGNVFRIYKFRTMRENGDEPEEVWARPDDPRITPIGTVLRKYRLDELPQLFNVLRGDMNLVGPRPEQPGIFAELREQIDRYPVRQRVLPGITGWAQVNQAYDQSLDDVRRKVDLDLEYLDRRSAAEDVRIMLRTVPVMLLRRGAM